MTSSARSGEATGTVRACAVDDLADGESMRLDTEPPVAVFRRGDEFFATSDSCTHEEWSLGEDGDLDGYEVTCPLHMARFDVRDGRALCFPAVLGLRTYPVEIADGEVLVRLSGGTSPE